MADGKLRPGILPSQDLRGLVAAGAISAGAAIVPDQIQPASVDLRLGPRAFRVRASFLSGPGTTVSERLKALSMHEIDIRGRGAVLERGCVYVVPLLERLDLDPGLSAIANPKSSTGRLDIFVRAITDHSSAFDRVAAGYRGPLYAEISPRTFSVLVHEGSRLNQLRIRAGRPILDDAALRALHQRTPLVDAPPGREMIEGGIGVTVDLEADGGPVGYRARRHVDVIDLDRIAHYEAADFWEPIMAGRRGLVLDPDDFYILASREAVTVPPGHAAEMVAYDTMVGEFRVHYAGFFDPGFGWAETGGTGSRAVLEVRSHDVPFVIEHGQVVGRLVYESMAAVPDRLYGVGIGSSYQRQRLKLAKQFKPWA